MENSILKTYKNEYETTAQNANKKYQQSQQKNIGKSEDMNMRRREMSCFQFILYLYEYSAKWNESGRFHIRIARL